MDRMISRLLNMFLRQGMRHGMDHVSRRASERARDEANSPEERAALERQARNVKDTQKRAKQAMRAARKIGRF